MQEKIAELMWARGERYEDSPDLHMNPMTVKVIADAIAKLFERKAIWEGEAYVDGFGRIRFLDSYSGELPIATVDDEELEGEMFYPSLAAGKGTVSPWAGKRVRVRVIE